MNVLKTKEYPRHLKDITLYACMCASV